MSPRGLTLCAALLSSSLMMAGWDFIQARETKRGFLDSAQPGLQPDLIVAAPKSGQTKLARPAAASGKSSPAPFPRAADSIAAEPLAVVPTASEANTAVDRPAVVDRLPSTVVADAQLEASFQEADDGSNGTGRQSRISADEPADDDLDLMGDDSAVADSELATTTAADEVATGSAQKSGGDQPVIDVTTVTPAGPTVEPLSPQLLELREKVRGVLKLYYPRHLNTRDHSNWEVMHGIISYGVDAKLFRGGPKGEKVNAIGWVCFNGSCAGEQMLYVHNNQLVARKGPGVQGHYGQFLAILAQSHVRSDYPIRVAGKSFTVADLIEHEKQDCEEGEELTFKLIALMHYLNSDATWKTRTGQQWSIERLIQAELKQPIRGAACGGTHRLMGFSYAVNKRQKRGEPLTGQFERAHKFIQDYHRYAFSLQNPDGSFSTEWLVRAAAKPDVDRRLKTTGHVLEWLSFSLSDEELRHPKTIKAIDYLAGILSADKSHAWEVGPLGHALHGLLLYDQRVFQAAEAANSNVEPLIADDSPTLEIESPADVVKKSKAIEIRK